MALTDRSCYGYRRVDRFYRTIRVVLFAVSVLAIWGSPRTAFASTAVAPVCDDRGASLIAPPPPLQAPEEELRRARLPECGTEELSVVVSVSQGRSPRSISSSPVEAAMPLPALALQAPQSAPGASLGATQGWAPGTRWRVERPPR